MEVKVGEVEMQTSYRHLPPQKKKKALTVIVKYHVQLEVNHF